MRIALCVPTFEREKVVEDFLENCAPYYIEAGIDICYYDSSKSNKTEEVVHKYMQSGHVFYIRLPADTKLDKKTIMIFQRYGIIQEYDFIWLSGDAIQYSKDFIQDIYRYVDIKYDIITIDASHRITEEQSKVICDINTYFDECVSPLTLYGSSVLNVHTMLCNVNWDRYVELCSNFKTENFLYILFYFERIKELGTFCGLDLLIPNNEIRKSREKKFSWWNKKYFSVWCQNWTETIMALPNSYKNKRRAIKNVGTDLLGNLDNFRRLRLTDSYSLKVFISYFKYWKKVTDIPMRKLFFVALIPKGNIKYFYSFRLLRSLNELKKFCKRHTYIYILGAGRVGKFYGEFLNKNSIKFEGFCALPGKFISNTLQEHKVFKYEQMQELLCGAGIILALGPDDTQRGLEILNGVVDKNDVFNKPTMRRDIAFDLGYESFII